MNLPKKVRLCEVGPRDGLESASRRLTVEEKVGLIESAVEAGFTCVEFGAFCRLPSMYKLADSAEVYKAIRKSEGVEYRALVYDSADILAAAEAGVKSVKINISADERHHVSGTGKTPLEALALLPAAGKAAQTLNIKMAGSISMPFVSPAAGIIPFQTVRALAEGFAEAGALEISLSDAGGLADPRLVFARTTALSALLPEVSWMLHLHDTAGMGLANVLAGLEAGVTKFDASFAGLGGCPYCPGASGNIATEDLAYMMRQMGIETGLDLQKIVQLGRQVERMGIGLAHSAVLKNYFDKGA